MIQYDPGVIVYSSCVLHGTGLVSGGALMWLLIPLIILLTLGVFLMAPRKLKPRRPRYKCPARRW